MHSSSICTRTCLGVFLGIRFRHEKRCKTGAFRHPNALLPGSETRVDFFATNACNLPKYALEHVWECSWAFCSGVTNDAKRLHSGTRMHYCRVAKLGWIFSQRMHATFRTTLFNYSARVRSHSVPARKTMQNGCISAPECTIAG